MATKANTKATTAAATKRTAPAPTSATGAGTVATTQAAQGTAQAQAAAPQAPLFTVGTMPPVRPGTHRAYAQHVARQCAQQHPKGFTLAQYKAALVAGAAASSIAPPRGGWQAHNMPTWASNPKQAWLVPVGK
jgi:CTP:molybdopterin cytidylyltransferase MocA